jgi:hypothetical protein
MANEFLNAPLTGQMFWTEAKFRKYENSQTFLFESLSKTFNPG